MRSAGNFSPEWGYLAPAPSFARTARVVLVATAIGATTGAGVVISLLDRPGESDKAPIAARAIVTSVRTASVPSVAPVAAAAAVTPSPAAPVSPASQPASIATAQPPSDRPDNSARASTRRTPTALRPSKAAAVKPAPAPAPSADTRSSAPPAAAQVTSAASAVDASAAGSTSTPAATPESIALPTEPPKVGEAAPGDATDSTSIMAPEPAAPPKKTKRHASSKGAPLPRIESIFKRMFAAHGSRSNSPNSQ